MDRRKSIKLLTLSALAATVLAESCEHKESSSMSGMEGMHHDSTPAKLSEYDQKLMKETFFNPYEMKQISVLTDLIIPKDEKFGGALEAKVPDFIEFMVKDQIEFQVPIRGGLRWLDLFSEREIGKSFLEANSEEQKKILDQIAYPLKAKKELSQGVKFFSLLRDLTASGYFPSEIGVKYLGYIGNVANVWDGPPPEVLKQLGVQYDPALLPLYVKPEDRTKPMTYPV